MKSSLFYGLILCGLLSILSIPTINAEVPSYVGIREGDEYIWQIEFNEEIYNQSVNDGIDEYFFQIFDSNMGLKCIIETIYPEVYEDGLHYVLVERILYITYSDLQENDWTFLGVQTDFMMVDPNDMNLETAALFMWITPIVPRFLNWSLVAQAITYDTAATWITYDWSRGISSLVYFTGTSIPLRLFNDYNSNGILNYTEAIYGYEKIASVSLISQPNTTTTPKNILGFPLMVFPVILCLSIVSIALIIKKDL